MTDKQLHRFCYKILNNEKPTQYKTLTYSLVFHYARTRFGFFHFNIIMDYVSDNFKI